MSEPKGNMPKTVLLLDPELEGVKFVAWSERPSGWNLPILTIPLGLGKTATRAKGVLNGTSGDVRVYVGFGDDSAVKRGAWRGFSKRVRTASSPFRNRVHLNDMWIGLEKCWVQSGRSLRLPTQPQSRLTN